MSMNVLALLRERFCCEIIWVLIEKIYQGYTGVCAFFFFCTRFIKV